MNIPWRVGYIIAVILGLAYVLLPKRIHMFGFEFLRRSPSDQPKESNTPIWLYRGLGVLFLFIGIIGVL